MEEQGKIPFSTAVLMNINVIVGVGIYFLPQLMVQRAGAFSCLSWVAAGLLLLPVVWTVATAARFFPGAGGFYNYGVQGINSLAGFTALWAYTIGFLATAAAQLMFLKKLVEVNGGFSFISTAPLLINAFLVLTIGLLNLLDVRVISKIQGFVTVLKLLPMFAAIILFVFYWNSAIEYTSVDLMNIGSTLPLAIFGYWGFESCTSTSHLIKGGSSKASGVMLTAFFVSMTLYALFHFAITHIMGIDAIAAQGAVGFTGFLGIVNPALVKLIGGVVVFALVLALFNAVYGVSLANVANMFSLAEKDHLVGSRLFRLVNGASRPYVIVFFQALVVFMFMSFVGEEKILVALSNFGLILALFITICSVLKTQMRRRLPVIGKMVSVVAIAASAVLAYYSWLSIGVDSSVRILNAVPFLLAMGLGLGMFYYTKCMNHGTK